MFFKIIINKVEEPLKNKNFLKTRYNQKSIGIILKLVEGDSKKL